MYITNIINNKSLIIIILEPTYSLIMIIKMTVIMMILVKQIYGKAALFFFRL